MRVSTFVKSNLKTLLLLLCILSTASPINADVTYDPVIIDSVIYIIPSDVDWSSGLSGRYRSYAAAMGVVDGFIGHAEIQSSVTFTGNDGRKVTMTVESIGYTALYDGWNEGIEGKPGFVNCPGLTSFSIPNTVTSIYGFFDCPGLTSIHIPSQVRILGNTDSDPWGFFISQRPFQGCINIERITVDDDNPNFDSRDDCNAIIQTWSNELIVGCKNTIIPSTVESISIDAFSSSLWPSAELHTCGIKEIHIPKNMTTIEKTACEAVWVASGYGYNLFRFCDSLSVITVDRDNPVYDSRDNCNALIETETNTLIAGCNNTIIPNTIKRINTGAFLGSGIRSIIIPESVTSIGINVFGLCDNLESITCKGITPPEADGGLFSCTFDDSYYESVTLYVPQSAINNYREDEEWGKFHHIKSINNGSVCDVNGDGEVNIADLNNVIHIICTGYAYLINYDVNGDGEVNIGDANTIIDFILHY